MRSCGWNGSIRRWPNCSISVRVARSVSRLACCCAIRPGWITPSGCWPSRVACSCVGWRWFPRAAARHWRIWACSRLAPRGYRSKCMHWRPRPRPGLRGAAELLQRRVHDEDLQSLAGLVIAEADRLTVLANRLLNHDGAPHLAPGNIHARLERLSDLLQAEPTPIRLRHDYDPSLPDVVGDADRIQQLLLNLARNAIEAGATTLGLRTRVEHGIRLSERTLRTA